MNEYITEALKLAKIAYKHKDVPVGALIVRDGKVIAKGYNTKEKYHNCLNHAEIIAIDKACKKLKTSILSDCEMYVTFEPCLMCVGAILSARLKKVYFGAYDKRFGASQILVDNNFNHKCKFEGGIMEEDCSKIITEFFKSLRESKSK